jgi:hypothetical protein
VEKKFQVASNGQQVITTDLNLLGETSALSDDRVFAELLRMTPYNGSTAARGILPYGSALTASAGTVIANGATGSVLVNPFRAFVGSRTAVATNAKENLRDIRSAIAVGTTTLGQSVSLAANASGNPRWDLVYATVAIEADDAGVTRKVKNPTTKVISGATVVITKSNTVTLGVVTGTPGASPSTPSTPADAGSNYVIPLAYVRIPNGFTAASTVTNLDIAHIAPIVAVAPATGGASVRLANNHNKIGLGGVSAAQMQAWGASTASRPYAFIGSHCGNGAESLLLAVDLTTGSETHSNGAILDDTRDWRRRVTKYMVTVTSGGSRFGAWASAGDAPRATPIAGGSGSSPTIAGLGHTFTVDTNRRVLEVVGTTGVTTPIANGTSFGLDVDSSGRLVLNFTGAPNAHFFVWLDLSGPFPQENT